MRAGATGFFEFLSKASAASNKETLIVHDPSLPLLKAAIHKDPTPAKGGGDITIVSGVALMSEQGPEGTIADLPDNKKGTITLYTVRQGETLSHIADAFDISVNTIVWANDLKSKTVRPGQELLILPVSGATHTVAKGDTLLSIAKRYGGDAEEIALFNGIDGGSLTIGEKIVIPGGEAPTPSSPRTQSVASGARTPAVTSSGPEIIGYYLHPVPGAIRTQGIHGYNAVDLAARTGTSVRAAAAGTVIVSRTTGWNSGYGAYVVVRHDNGTQTLYAHMSRVDVSVGDVVAQGTALGAVGNTGRSTGPHLHFEVRGAKNPF